MMVRSVGIPGAAFTNEKGALAALVPHWLEAVTFTVYEPLATGERSYLSCFDPSALTNAAEVTGDDGSPLIV
jgi:hypothetical protein